MKVSQIIEKKGMERNETNPFWMGIFKVVFERSGSKNTSVIS